MPELLDDIKVEFITFQGIMASIWNDLKKGVIVTTTGLGLYGLYYRYKQKRIQQWVRESVSVELTKEEKICISLLIIHSKRLIQNTLAKLYKMMKDEWGYDLNKDGGGSADTGHFARIPFVFIYFELLKSIRSLYTTHNHSSQPNRSTQYSGENTSFLTEWLTLLGDSDDSVNDGVSDTMTFSQSPAGDETQEYLINMAKNKIENTIRQIYYTYKGDNWTHSWDTFQQTLTEKKCMNTELLNSIDSDVDNSTKKAMMVKLWERLNEERLNEERLHQAR